MVLFCIFSFPPAFLSFFLIAHAFFFLTYIFFIRSTFKVLLLWLLLFPSLINALFLFYFIFFFAELHLVFFAVLLVRSLMKVHTPCYSVASSFVLILYLLLYSQWFLLSPPPGHLLLFWRRTRFCATKQSTLHTLFISFIFSGNPLIACISYTCCGVVFSLPAQLFLEIFAWYHISGAVWIPSCSAGPRLWRRIALNPPPACEISYAFSPFNKPWLRRYLKRKR